MGRKQFALGIAAILFMALLSALAIYQLRPTAAAPIDAPASEFSSSRALTHIRTISHKPRPMGAAEHSVARDYILSELTDAGLTAEVQRTMAVRAFGSGTFRAGTVENVIGRLKGTANTRAILLMCHYDSVSTSFGAGDDGSGVGVLLETLRAIKSGPALGNDVIFLFTDGEEIARFGARAFVDEHPWAKEVGLVLNFEARGVNGPSILFETSEQNGRLIKEFAKAAPHPVANSLAYEIYRLLPNNTDLTEFKDAGIAGLNFAYLGRSTHYHNQLDNIDELDANSVQHHGAYALALTKHFGNLDLQNVKERNAVYFDVAGLFLVRYSGALVLFITLLITTLFVGLMVLGWRKGRFRLACLGVGLGVHLGTLIVVPAGFALGWMVVQALLNAFGRSQAVAYQSQLYFIGFVALAIAISYIPYGALVQKVGVENFMASSLAFWLLLLIVTSALLPGVSYLFTWPTLFCLPALAYFVLTSEQRRTIPILFFLLAVTPALLILAPAIHLTFIGLNLNAIGTILAVLILVCVLLMPHFLSLRLGHHRVFAVVVALVGVLFLGVAALRSGYDARHPKLDSLFYGLNADTGKAVWASFDGKSDEWTGRVLSATPQKGTAPEFFAAGRAGSLLRADATAAALPAPDVNVITDSTRDTVRTLKLRITSPRGAPVLSTYIDSVKNLQGMWINGKRLEIAGPSNIHYYNVLEGIELTLEFSSAEPLKLRVVDQSYGLPENTVGARPSGIIPAPIAYSDATVVSKSFNY